MGLKVLKYCILLSLIFGSGVSFNFSSSNNEPESAGGEFISANVETLSFKSSNIPTGVTGTKINGGDFITFIVQGFDAAGNSIVITVPEYEGEGTYNLGNDNGSFKASAIFANQQTVWGSAVEGGSGSVTIMTDTATETKGKFEFIGIEADDQTSTKTVTNGSFKVNFDN